MECDVLVAGAGPVGSRTAELLASEGLDVVVIDKKREAGKQACSGLVSARLKELVRLPRELILHKVKGAVFHSPSERFTLRLDKTLAYVINRPLFDSYTASRAEKAGSRLLLGTAIKSFSIRNNAITAKTSSGAIKSRMIIGADGAGSLVRRVSGLPGKLSFVSAAITRTPTPDSSNLVELYYGRDIARGFFAWKIPRGSTTEYGLGSSEKHLSYFKKFLKHQGVSPAKVHSHPIVYGIQETASDNLLLVGDAASQVKPFSGGGIIYGLIGAGFAAKAVKHAFDKHDFSSSFLKKHYDAAWKSKLLKPIEAGLGIRNTLNSLSDNELDSLFQLLSEGSESLKIFGDMDFL